MSPPPARIGVFTATRAEYGLLRPVIRALTASRRLEPVLIVSGTHLSSVHGATMAEIEADAASGGPAIAARVPVPLAGDDGVSVAADMAAVLAGCAKAYADLALDAVLILGDRTEALAAAAAAVPLALPVLHLEGGHRTTGAVDDAVRHAITKLAALHFTAAEPYRRRILQLGEAPERVFAVGSTAVDNLVAFGRRDRAELSADIGFDLEPGYLLATFHPETLSDRPPAEQIDAFLSGLARVPDLKLLLTAPNADAGSGAVRRALETFVADRPERAVLVESLGARRYAWAVQAAEAVVGNSSSGVIEAPAAGVPSVDVGARQDGRLATPGVVRCELEPDAVSDAIARALSPEVRAAARDQPPPFGDGRAADRIVAALEAADFAGLARKPFVDL